MMEGKGEIKSYQEHLGHPLSTNSIRNQRCGQDAVSYEIRVMLRIKLARRKDSAESYWNCAFCLRGSMGLLCAVMLQESGTCRKTWKSMRSSDLCLGGATLTL